MEQETKETKATTNWMEIIRTIFTIATPLLLVYINSTLSSIQTTVNAVHEMKPYFDMLA